jgi:N-acetyl-anhydromuramyl-L-alanine amidase AmpD
VNAEYPGALWMPADASNFRANRSLAVNLIVIHVTDGHADPRGTARMWQTPHHGSSAHFVIGQDGTIVQSVKLSDVAFHAHAANWHSIGIEHSARSPREWDATDAGMPPTAVQLAASAKLVAWLCKRFNLPLTRGAVKGHAEADPASTHADCPEGAGLSVDALVANAGSL